mmetsp:Transcript_32758/g.82608  ORF Transcript_32758/g.82608 Transcript_32758/m.82608 type:complete len:280 (-) Transcript_32758:150-989(-)
MKPPPMKQSGELGTAHAKLRPGKQAHAQHPPHAPGGVDGDGGARVVDLGSLHQPDGVDGEKGRPHPHDDGLPLRDDVAGRADAHEARDEPRDHGLDHVAPRLEGRPRHREDAPGAGGERRVDGDDGGELDAPAGDGRRGPRVEGVPVDPQQEGPEEELVGVARLEDLARHALGAPVARVDLHVPPRGEGHEGLGLELLGVGLVDGVHRHRALSDHAVRQLVHHNNRQSLGRHHRAPRVEEAHEPGVTHRTRLHGDLEHPQVRQVDQDVRLPKVLDLFKL